MVSKVKIITVKIVSPICTGNGAFIVHKVLEKHIDNYGVQAYHPYWTIVPFFLPFFRENNCDIVHTTPDYAPFFINSNAKTVLTFHNYVLDGFMHPYSTTLQKLHYQTDLKWFIKRSLKQAEKITSVSDFTAQLVKGDLGFDGDIQVIPNGIDTDLFHPRSQNYNTKKIKVLFSGNLTLRKGAQWLPRIAEKFNDNIELLYTRGLNKTKLTIMEDNLRCIGAVLYEDMPALYNSADVLLMPTVREGMSVAVLEAMACGLPVVATDCSSLPELIEHGRGGYLCPLGDVAEFAKKINTLAENPGLRKQMGEFNRSRVEERFTLKMMLGQYQYVFEEVRNSH